MHFTPTQGFLLPLLVGENVFKSQFYEQFYFLFQSHTSLIGIYSIGNLCNLPYWPVNMYKHHILDD